MRIATDSETPSESGGSGATGREPGPARRSSRATAATGHGFAGMAPRRRSARPSDETVGRRIRLDRRVWTALEMLARDRDNTPAELVEEAIGDVLRKHGRSADLREALELSARAPRKTERTAR